MTKTLTAHINEMLIAGEPYKAVLESVRRYYPTANTTARSLASMATALRKKGHDVANRGGGGRHQRVEPFEGVADFSEAYVAAGDVYAWH